MRILQSVAKRCLFFFLLLAVEMPLFLQSAQSGPSLPLPWPRHKQQPGAESKSAPTQRSTGKLTKLDDQSIMVEMEDGRVLDFKRTDKTRFLRGTQEIKAAELKPGEQVTVESTEDKEGYLYAGNVTLEKSGAPEAPPAPPSASPAPGAPTPAATPPPEAGGRAPGNIPAPLVSADDSGPPKLKRLAPGQRRKADTEAAAATPEAPVTPAAPATPARAAERPAAQQAGVEPGEPAPYVDPVIEKARAAAASFTERLPNYVCTEFMARYESTARPVDWRPLDVVSTNVVYEAGRESYRDISVNGKPFKKGMEDMSGAWSTGEFGTMLLNLFAPWTAAEFHQRRTGAIGGIEARVYNFEVDRAHSNWHVQVASQSMRPAYRGAVWIEPENGRVLRLEMQARGLPHEFPEDTVESAVDYENVMIGGVKFLLPVHAETLACERGTSNCSRNVLDFRNYHKFEATSDVTFGSEK